MRSLSSSLRFPDCRRNNMPRSSSVNRPFSGSLGDNTPNIILLSVKHYCLTLQSYCFFLICARILCDLGDFSCLGHLGFKEFLFRMAQTIISMFALRTRAAHLLIECPPDTLRCALTASCSSHGHRSVGRRRNGKYRVERNNTKKRPEGRFLWMVYMRAL